MKKTLLGTGLSGLVGTRIQQLLSNTYDFEDLSFDTGVDITDYGAVEKKILASSSNWVLHLAAKADVDGCEADKPSGTAGAAWKINVGGTENIVKAAKKSGKKVLYISTDFVFDGTQPFYSETDTPHPLNWYGQTKCEGEERVLVDNINIVVRIAYPYQAVNLVKKDFLHQIAQRLQKGDQIAALSDHWYTPTFVDDIALALQRLIEKNASGIYHVVGSSHLTPYQAAQEVARTFGYKEGLVVATTINEYYKNRASRPYKLQLKNDKIASLGIVMSSFSQGLARIKEQGLIL